MIMTEAIVNVIINLIYTLLIAYVYSKCFSRRLSNLQYAALYAAFFVALNIQDHFDMIPILNTVFHIAIIVTPTFFYKSQIGRMMLTPGFVYIWGMISEAMTELIFAQFPQVDFALFDSSHPIFLIALCLAKLLHFLLVLLVPVLLPNKNSISIPLSHWLTVGAFPVTSYYFVHNLYVAYQNEGLRVMHIQIFIFFLLFSLYGLYIFGRMSNDYFESTAQNAMNNQYISITNSIDFMGKNNNHLAELRHEVVNILLSLKLSAKNGDHNQAIALVDSALDTIGAWVDNGPCRSGNQTFDDIVNYKIAEAANNKVQIKASIVVPRTLKLNPYPILAIINNAIDNSIEACLKLQESERQVLVSIIVLNKQLLISIENPFNEELIQTENGDFITTKVRDGVQHGIGLVIIKKITEQFHGYYDIHVENNRFRLLVVLNLTGMSNIDKILTKEMST